MNLGYFLLGLALLVLALVDILWTTLWVDRGAGPLSSVLTTALWRTLRRVGGSRSSALSLAGPLMLVATLGVWVAAIWAGWTLVFAAGDAALVNARNPGGVSWTGRIYFVAYTMFTMGNGDFYPGSGGWQLATALTTASGMLFVTMGVSYVLSVLGAVSEKRAFASTVTGLGERSETIVTRGYSGGDFDDLHVPLSTLAGDLDLLAEQHRSYPILNYYHTEEPSQAAPNGVAVLDDALTLLRYAVPDADQPNRALLAGARAANRNYLDSLNTSLSGTVDEPPPPDIDTLRASAVPTVTDEAFDAAVADLGERRQTLREVVVADAWRWPPVDP